MKVSEVKYHPHPPSEDMEKQSATAVFSGFNNWNGRLRRMAEVVRHPLMSRLLLPTFPCAVRRSD